VARRRALVSFSDQTPTRVLASILDDMADEGDRTLSDRTLVDADVDDHTVVEPKPPCSEPSWTSADETKAGHYERVSLGKYKLTEGVVPKGSAPVPTPDPATDSPAPPSSVAPVAMPAVTTGSFETSAGIERTAIALCATLLTTAALFGVIAAFVSARTSNAAQVSTLAALDAERLAAK
jgi:hypothetical protein